MLEPKRIDLEGMKFQLIPMPALEAAALDAQILRLLIPVLGGIEDFSLEAKINMESLSRGLSQVLLSFDKTKTQNLITDFLKYATYLESGKSPQELDASNINTIFQGKINLVYRLMFEIMKFNKFTPFVFLGGDGNLMSKISTFVSQNKEEKPSGKKSEPSGSLLDH